jgi:predicted nucleic acid-binding protein
VRPVVVDASAWVEYLLGTEGASATREWVEAGDVELHVPALCDIEVVAALRRVLLSSRAPIDSTRANEALEDYLDLPVGRHGHDSLLARVLELRDNFSAYDAAYVALAERLGATLVTGDRRLANAVNAHLRVAVNAIR